MTSVTERTSSRLMTRALLALVLLAGPARSEAQAAIAFVRNVGVDGNTVAGTSISVTLAGGVSVAVGHTLIVTFVMDPSAGAVSCADSKGNSYTVDADVTNGSGTSGVRTVVCSATVATALGTNNTITVTHPLATSKALSVNEFSGVRAAALDQTAGATGNSTTPASGATALTAQPNELLIGAIGVETKKTESFTAGAGYSALTSSSSGPALGNATDNVTIDPEYRIVAATGSYTADGTLGRQRLWAAAIATYRSTCGDGTLDPGEQCDDANNLNGDCCSAACQIEAAGTVCRPVAGVCDVAETCTGTSGACPADAFVPATTQCRASAGECDVAEFCPGNGPSCPADAKQPSGTACTDDGNSCTTDTCDGIADACQHPAGNAGTVCRASAGVCDPAETCDGTSPSCPADAKSPPGTVCRPVAGVCDVAETCDGTSPTCPADAFASAATQCRASAGACDPAESCTGTSAACPADGKSTAECRPVAGPCDVAESCDGVGNDCPADAFAPATQVCRAAAGECDPAENCPGNGASCPADAKQPGGTACTDDGNPCTTDTCDGTNDACQHPAGNAGAVCRASAGACDPAESCTRPDAARPADAKSTGACP